MSEISRLRTRVRIETPLRVADEIGGAALAWFDRGETWAEVAVRGASAVEAFDTAGAVANVVVTLRRPGFALAGARVVRGEAVYLVRAVRDDGGPLLELVCEEETL